MNRPSVFLSAACVIAVLGISFCYFKPVKNGIHANPYQNDLEVIQQRKSESSSMIKVLETGRFQDGGAYSNPYVIFQHIETKRVYISTGSFIKELSKE
jgi:dethiobiotin synthetase